MLLVSSVACRNAFHAKEMTLCTLHFRAEIRAVGRMTHGVVKQPHRMCLVCSESTLILVPRQMAVLMLAKQHKPVVVCEHNTNESTSSSHALLDKHVLQPASVCLPSLNKTERCMITSVFSCVFVSQLLAASWIHVTTHLKFSSAPRVL